LRVGTVPVLASAFRDRIGLREQVDAARGRAAGAAPTQVLVGGGGVGKSQLAAFRAHQAIKAGVDLVVWVDAGHPETVLATYALAAARVGAPGADGSDADADARAFLDWLATTSRSWLVVLDDITEPDHVAPWWPTTHAGTGWVLATSRRRDAALSGGGRDIINVDVYAPAEALSYLTERLSTAGGGHLLDRDAAPLAGALGYLPLALSHAAGYMVNQDVPCTAYLRLYADRRTKLAEAMPRTADTEGYGRSVAVTLLLAVDAAQASDPPGLALPALRLAAVLDPAGHTEALWAAGAIIDYLTAQRTPPANDATAVTPVQARAAVRLLHRYSLITHNAAAGPRAVRIHALTARAAGEAIPETELPAIVHAAADALLEVWPSSEPAVSELSVALRANTDTLITHAGDLLWQPSGHQLLHHAGNSLLGAGLFEADLTYWQRLVGDAMRVLGHQHADTLGARGNLAVALQRVGRTDEAIRILEAVSAEAMTLFGPDSVHTINARAKLGISYEQAGRLGDAVRIAEEVATARMHVNGPDHLDTLGARANLAAAYRLAGHRDEAVQLGERVAADHLRILGPDNMSTLRAQLDLAVAYRLTGRRNDAVRLSENAATDHERVLGADHPDTLVARAHLANAYQEAGRLDEAIAIHAQVAIDTESILGPLHPDTLASRSNLADACRDTGLIDQAIAIGETVAADSARILGPHHPNTLTAQANLARSYQQAGHLDQAIRLGEQVSADQLRILGPDHPDTLTAQGNLAYMYSDAGLIDEAIAIEETVAADSARILGPHHPDTLTARCNLAVSYWEGGRTRDAITIATDVAADMRRTLGSEHPDTEAVTDMLSDWLRSD